MIPVFSFIVYAWSFGTCQTGDDEGDRRAEGKNGTVGTTVNCKTPWNEEEWYLVKGDEVSEVGLYC